MTSCFELTADYHIDAVELSRIETMQTSQKFQETLCRLRGVVENSGLSRSSKAQDPLFEGYIGLVK